MKGSYLLALIVVICFAIGLVSIRKEDSVVKVWEDVAGFTSNPLDTLTSEAYYIGSSESFGVYYKAVSDTSTPNVSIDYLQSYSRNGEFVEPEGGGSIVTSLTDESPHVKSFTPANMRYLKFRIRGLTGNAGDTKVTLIFFARPSIIR